MVSTPFHLLLTSDDPQHARCVAAACEADGSSAESGLRLRLTHTATLPAAEQLLNERAFHALLLDLGAFGSAGLDGFHRLQTAALRTPVILLASSPQHPDCLAAMSNGAAGCLATQFKNTYELRRELHRVIRGLAQGNPAADAWRQIEALRRRVDELQRENAQLRHALASHHVAQPSSIYSEHAIFDDVVLVPSLTGKIDCLLS